MKKFIIGKKLGMTTVFDSEVANNVTLIECVPNEITCLKNKERDGYCAIQISFPKTTKRMLKKEFRIDDGNDKIEFKKGNKIDVTIFEKGEKVCLSGKSKAKGFQGVVKRHGFAGSPASHGHRHDLRAPGSIGCGFPEHVIKGKRMAGRMGGKRKTVKNLEIVLIDKEKNMIALKGAVPGISGGLVEIYN